MNVSDSALPWILFAGCVLGGLIGGLLAVFVDRYVEHRSLPRLPILNAPYGCDDCSAENDEPHRYAGCPGNVRQLEREAGR